MSNYEYEYIVMICCGVHCSENKSIEIRKKLEEELTKHSIKDKAFIFYEGCFGMCQRGPVIEILDPYFMKTTYIRSKLDDIEDLVNSHFINHVQYKKLLLDESLVGKK